MDIALMIFRFLVQVVVASILAAILAAILSLVLIVLLPFAGIPLSIVFGERGVEWCFEGGIEWFFRISFVLIFIDILLHMNDCPNFYYYLCRFWGWLRSKKK